MDNAADTAQVIIRPPLAWGLGVIAGLALNWIVPLPFLPADLPAAWFGAMVFVLALALFAWAIVTITRAGSHVPTHLPTTTIVESGPYRFTRNPIYLGMILGLILSARSVMFTVATARACGGGCSAQRCELAKCSFAPEVLEPRR